MEGWGEVVVVVVSGSGAGAGGGGAGVYFTGDSLERKSRKLGSRSRRGSLFVDFGGSDLPQNQPIVGWRKEAIGCSGCGGRAES